MYSEQFFLHFLQREILRIIAATAAATAAAAERYLSFHADSLYSVYDTLAHTHTNIPAYP